MERCRARLCVRDPAFPQSFAFPCSPLASGDDGLTSPRRPSTRKQPTRTATSPPRPTAGVSRACVATACSSRRRRGHAHDVVTQPDDAIAPPRHRRTRRRASPPSVSSRIRAGSSPPAPTVRARVGHRARDARVGERRAPLSADARRQRAPRPADVTCWRPRAMTALRACGISGSVRNRRSGTRGSGVRAAGGQSVRVGVGGRGSEKRWAVVESGASRAGRRGRRSAWRPGAWWRHADAVRGLAWGGPTGRQRVAGTTARWRRTRGVAVTKNPHGDAYGDRRVLEQPRRRNRETGERRWDGNVHAMDP